MISVAKYGWFLSEMPANCHVFSFGCVLQEFGILLSEFSTELKAHTYVRTHARTYIFKKFLIF